MDEDVLFQVQLGRAGGCAGVGGGEEQLGRGVLGQDRAGPGKLAIRFAGRGGGRIDVDQRLDIGEPGRGVGDDGSSVGVPHQYNWAGDGLEVVGDVFRIGRQVLQRVRDGPRVVAGCLQGRDFTAPAGGIRPGAVDQDHRRPGLARGQARAQLADEHRFGRRAGCCPGARRGGSCRGDRERCRGHEDGRCGRPPRTMPEVEAWVLHGCFLISWFVRGPTLSARTPPGCCPGAFRLTGLTG